MCPGVLLTACVPSIENLLVSVNAEDLETGVP